MAIEMARLPHAWGIIDLADAVEEAVENTDTKQAPFRQMKLGVGNLMKRLMERECLSIPEDPNTNVFGGKLVFKARLAQPTPPEPFLVGGKGILKLGRQWGFRFLPDCPAEPTSDSSSSGQGYPNSTPR